MTSAEQIVVGVDSSPESLFALDTAADIGAPAEAELVVVFVLHHGPELAFSAAATAECEWAFDSAAVDIEATVVAALSTYPGTWRVEHRYGDPATELIDAARQCGARLIVVGHRGRGRLADALLGSVASRLVHDSPVSVLVARPPRA